MNQQIGNELINAAIEAGIVTYNRHGVGSFRITHADSLLFTYDKRGLADGTYGAEGSFQVRRRAGKCATVVFND